MINLKRVFCKQEKEHKQLSKTQLLDQKVGMLNGLADIESSLDLTKRYLKENFDRIGCKDAEELSTLVSDIENQSLNLWSLSHRFKRKNDNAEGSEGFRERENDYDHLDFDDLDALDDDSPSEQQAINQVNTDNDVFEASDEPADTKPLPLKLRFDEEFIHELNDKISANSCQCGHHFNSHDIRHAYDGEYDEPDENPRRIMWLRCPECDSEYKMTIRPRIWLTEHKEVQND